MSDMEGLNMGHGAVAQGKGLLANAEREAKARGFDQFTIVDTDCHHYEVACLPEIAKYIEDEYPAIKRAFEKYHVESLVHNMIPASMGDREIAARVRRDRPGDDVDPDTHPVIRNVKHSMNMMGIDYSLLFPTPLLSLGIHPDIEVEVALSRAYTKWLIDHILSVEPSIKATLYLPFNDPQASLRAIEEFGDKPGVVGFTITSVRYQPVHHNKYMKVYAALEERGLPVNFHSALRWEGERNFEQLNKFLTVHALGFPFYNMIHLSNVVINGLPERFPNIKWVFTECGVAWLPFMMHRLDNEYAMRPSEAPSLQKKPSEYITDFFYTSQPIEMPENMAHLEMYFEMIKADTQLMYASDYPHWDFDLPTQIYDLPFLDEKAKRQILGGNAMNVFNLPDPRQEGERTA